METTYPYESTSPGVARHQCLECGGWERADKGTIRHSKRCDSKPQASVAAPATNEIKTFARNVRQYGLAKGRTEDLVEAVRGGYLSVSAAMNTDD